MQIQKRTISAPGKVDVSVVHPATGEHLANISAKNYSTLRDIHLLKNGNLLGMIAAWPLGPNPDSYNYIYTGLGHWKNDFFLSQAKALLAIQSAAGRNQNENELADILILNIRDQKNRPIRVISIYDLMERALLDKENTNKAFKVSIKPQLPIRSRKDETYIKSALSISVDTTLQKQWLKNYLSLGLIKK